MPSGLRRYHESKQSHFVTFSCYQRKPKFVDARRYDFFPICLEQMRRRFRMRIYGDVLMAGGPPTLSLKDQLRFEANGFSILMPALRWPAFRSSEMILVAPLFKAPATMSASQNPMRAWSSMRKALEISAGVMSTAQIAYASTTRRAEALGSGRAILRVTLI